MPYVEEQELVSGPLEEVWLFVADMQRFPEFMPDVESVEIQARSSDGLAPFDWVEAIAEALTAAQVPSETPWTVSEWVAYHKGSPVIWTEVDVFDRQNRTIRYSLIEGDINKLEGAWRLIKEGDQTRVVLSVDIDFGAPNIQKLIGPQLKFDTRKNSRAMLEAIKEHFQKV